MADCITIKGKEYRVEVDMLVLDQYLRSQGETDLASVQFGRPGDMLMLIWLALAEGAALDGVELDITPEDLWHMRRPDYKALVDQFEPVFRAQVVPDIEQDPKGGKKKATEPRL